MRTTTTSVFASLFGFITISSPLDCISADWSSAVELPQINVLGERLVRFTTKTVVPAEPSGDYQVFVEYPPRWQTGHVFLASGLRDRDEIVAINGRSISSVDRNDMKKYREYLNEWFRDKFLLSVRRRVAIGKYETFEVEAVAERKKVFEVQRALDAKGNQK